MGIDVRRKGKRCEREICNLLNSKLFSGRPVFCRTYHAVDAQLFDVANPYGLAIEVKCQAASRVPTWWRQACAQVTETHPTPLLIAKIRRRPWVCYWADSDPSPDDIPMSRSLDELVEWLQARIGQRKHPSGADRPLGALYGR